VSLEARKDGVENADGGETQAIHLKSRCSRSLIKKVIQNVRSTPSPIWTGSGKRVLKDKVIAA